ncbi:MAG TPA: CRTAC1 family protein [Candidatus Saccharimonadales bacterium]|nr:CRTAC1 family protein [Candidatus Saccharimonadales bacterium]
MPAPPLVHPKVPKFSEIAKASGLDFQHYLGATGKFYFPEIMGAGCALLDYDGDGDLDVYMVQGALLEPGADPSKEIFNPGMKQPVRNRLFRNDLIGPGGVRGPLHFTDVTEASGAGDTGYGMGVAVGDYDNDGDPDIYVTNFGPDVLLRNNGDGTFTDVTKAAGLGDPRWDASAAFLDYDGDGWLDLIVTAYADFTLATNKPCYTAAGARDYCGPTAYLSLPCRLYRNLHDGRFEDTTAAAGLDLAYGHGLGVATGDFDGDGRTDLYIANDSDADQLWLNRGGRFENVALLHGAAYNGMGIPEAGMGIAVDDFDDDGDEDIFLTHLIQEENRLLVNNGKAYFTDETEQWGLAWPSVKYTGFGVGWVDLDNDGDLELYVVNGNVRMEEVHHRLDYPFDQENLLMINTGSRYVGIPADAGPITSLSEVSRGAAFGDVDNDGDIDVLVSNNNGPARLFRNDLENEQHWLLLKVLREDPERVAIGAHVRLTLSDGRVMTRRVRTDGSYLSASDDRVHLAWLSGLSATRLEVALPGGAFQEVPLAATERVLTLRVWSDRVEIGD